MIIDFHVRAFPDVLPFTRLRRQARRGWRPGSRSLHRGWAYLRLLPPPFRRSLEKLSKLAPIAGLILESTPSDLEEAFIQAKLDYAVVTSQSAWAPHEWILEICADHPRWIPAVQVPVPTPRVAETLKGLVARGAKVLKIDADIDGEPLDSPHYRTLLSVATDLGLPVIVPTGGPRSSVEQFTPWFRDFPQTRFILAQMNLHEPDRALDIAEAYPRTWVDTSWQPAEVIAEAVRRLGPERVLFGSDWPMLGQNIRVGLARIRDGVQSGLLRPSDAQLILGENAAKILGIPCP